MQSQTGTSKPGGWLRAPGTWVFLAFLAIAGFFLVTEHTAHVIGVLPFLLLLACPLLHLFLHKGQGTHSAHDKEHAGHTASQPHGETER